MSNDQYILFVAVQPRDSVGMHLVPSEKISTLQHKEIAESSSLSPLTSNLFAHITKQSIDPNPSELKEIYKNRISQVYVLEISQDYVELTTKVWMTSEIYIPMY